MSAIGIVQIHDVISRHRSQYCCICFLPAADRKLVEPVHLKNFISKLNNANGFKKNIQVCYICEGLAMSAERFVRAVELASRVSDLFTNMDQTRWRNIINYLKEPDSVPKVLNRQLVSHRALELEVSLRSAPRYELRRTDTLVVPSPPPRQDTPIVMQHANPVITTVMSPLTPVMPLMALGAPVAPPVSMMAPRVPTVMAPTTPVLPSTRNQKISVDQDLKVVKVVNNDTKQVILHPMVQSLDGNVYVPSLQLQILDNGLLKSVTNFPNLQTSPPSLTPVNPQNSTLRNNDSKLRNILQKERNAEKNKSNYYKFLVSQMEQKQSQNAIEIIKMNDLNIVLNDEDSTNNKRKRREDSIERTLSDVQLLLTKNAEGSSEVKYEIIDDDEDVTKESRIEPPAKGPVERTDRTVDWEDKIPMDVISFMDATDPHPEERIMQPPPMGFISDVRSVPHEPIDCIDLC